MGYGLPLRRAGRPGAGPRSRGRAHSGAAARPDRPHPRALRRGRGQDLHPPRTREAVRHRDARIRSARGGRAQPPQGGRYRRLATRPDPPLAALVRDRSGAGTRAGAGLRTPRSSPESLSNRPTAMASGRARTGIIAAPGATVATALETALKVLM